jgi:Ni/Fe-hydrogenase subunit HybB-like protein
VSWKQRVKAALGPQAMWAAVAAVGLGVAAFATGLTGGGAPRAFAALIASWLFFVGAAVGAVAFRALFRLINAGWARPLGPLAGTTTAFLPAAAVLLVVILAGAGVAPWIPHPDGWLATPLLVVRQLAVNALLFALAYGAFRATTGTGGPTVRTSVVYLVLFSIVLSIWAFDFVLGPALDYGNTLIGPYVFVGSFIAGAGIVTLLGMARGVLSDRQRFDAAALVLTISIFWAYLFWSQYLTIWYGNLPDEVGFALRRSVDGWGAVVAAVVILVFVIPFLGLLNPRGRRSAPVLRTVLVAQLFGLWLNCNLMVLPSLSAPGTTPLGLRDLLIALGILGAFVLSVGGKLSPTPAPAA